VNNKRYLRRDSVYVEFPTPKPVLQIGETRGLLVDVNDKPLVNLLDDYVDSQKEIIEFIYTRLIDLVQAAGFPNIESVKYAVEEMGDNSAYISVFTLETDSEYVTRIEKLRLKELRAKRRRETDKNRRDALHNVVIVV